MKDAWIRRGSKAHNGKSFLTLQRKLGSIRQRVAQKKLKADS